MTSDGAATACFVYVTLPGASEPVTAGRFVQERQRSGLTLGRFVYGRSYLARPDAVAFDPVELKLSERTYETVALGGVFGALRDSSPDYWGRRVIERHVGKPQLGELDYLLHSPDDRAGALGFGLNQTPPAPMREFNKTIQLARLQAIADAIVADDGPPIGAEAAHVEELLLIGTSMGGARPKAVVEADDGLWIAKFNRQDDRWNVARIEHAMLLLARACGLSTAESRLESVGDRDVLLVKRFDRERTAGGYHRARMISGLTLVRTDDAPGNRARWSYVLLAEELRRASARPDIDATELFRRMSFNALISNSDDHPRNHAMIARHADWRLSPAYDLTPTSPVSQDYRDLALLIGDEGRFANAHNLLSQCSRFMLTREHGTAIIEAMMRMVTDRWYEIARSVGVREGDCALIAGAFAYPGFQTRSGR
ncbi:MAG TPA: HipA domain-containing protein [Caulobacteraceae bacterium]|jgi:serine/threonine-protein kinase HipA|nr:HipA domain-containing protein [Caulobacteraceae bacterium]